MKTILFKRKIYQKILSKMKKFDIYEYMNQNLDYHFYENKAYIIKNYGNVYFSFIFKQYL